MQAGVQASASRSGVDTAVGNEHVAKRNANNIDLAATSRRAFYASIHMYAHVAGIMQAPEG